MQIVVNTNMFPYLSVSIHCPHVNQNLLYTRPEKIPLHVNRAGVCKLRPQGARGPGEQAMYQETTKKESRPFWSSPVPDLVESWDCSEGMKRTGNSANERLQMKKKQLQYLLQEKPNNHTADEAQLRICPEAC